MGIERKLQSGSKFQQAKLAKTRGRREALEAERRQAKLRDGSQRNDLVPELEVNHVRLSDLRPSRYRARRSTPEHVERLMSAISDLGFTVPILISEGEIIDGHIRAEAAGRLGLEEVCAIDVSHLSATDIRQLALAANRLGELGEWDIDLLRIEFQDLIDLDVDLGATGFTLAEQDIILLDPLDGAVSEVEEIGEPPPVPVTRLGDIWELDGHRVICGNALEAETYAQLLQGELADAVLQDPPYLSLIHI